MPALVVVHSIWRWAVLILGIAATVKGFVGWFGRRPFGSLDRQLGQYYALSLDIQVLLGLIIWIVERRWTLLLAGAPADRAAAFFSIEHPFMMILALGIAHMGRALSRRALARGQQFQAAGAAAGGGGVAATGGGDADVSAHRLAAIFYLISLLIIIAGIPWDRLFR